MIHKEAWYREALSDYEELEDALRRIYRGEGDENDLARAKRLYERMDLKDPILSSKIRNAKIWIEVFRNAKDVVKNKKPGAYEEALAFLRDPSVQNLYDFVAPHAKRRS